VSRRLVLFDAKTPWTARLVRTYALAMVVSAQKTPVT